MYCFYYLVSWYSILVSRLCYSLHSSSVSNCSLKYITKTNLMWRTFSLLKLVKILIIRMIYLLLKGLGLGVGLFGGLIGYFRLAKLSNYIRKTSYQRRYNEFNPWYAQVQVVQKVGILQIGSRSKWPRHCVNWCKWGPRLRGKQRIRF